MMFELFMLALLLGVAFAGYDESSEKTAKKDDKWKKESTEEKSTEEASEVEEQPKPQHYDEVYAASYTGQLYGASALYGSANWREWTLNAGGEYDLYQPAGIKLCNGKIDEWGRWAYAYVADAGDAEHPGAVYQYTVKRDAEHPGEFQLEGQELIYGGEEKVGMKEVAGWGKQAPAHAADSESASEVEAATEVSSESVKKAVPPAPTDVACDPATGGIFIADNNHGQVVWNGKARDNDNEAWVSNECNDAVHGVQAAVKEDKWVYWSTHNAENPEASGVYRQDVSKGEVNCAEAVQEKSWLKKGGDVEKVAEHDDGAWGVAVHNDKVLLAEEGIIYSAGEVNKEKEPERWSWGHGHVRKIADAKDRGVVYADEKEEGGGVYVTSGGAQHNKVAEVPAAYGVDYYAGEKWERDEEDSASGIVLSAVALVAAVAAL